MKTVAANRLVANLLTICCLSACSDGQFEADLRAAQENNRTAAGAEYSAKLTGAIHGDPAVVDKLRQCVEGKHRSRTIRGYLHFTSSANYRVVLKPNNEFSQCISSALEGIKVPAPPTVPYFSDQSATYEQ